ncbi:predicted protein [Nematostella vectensis]|uniref:L-dopachrome isomerase n=1 Tax=Nematostella vectensis TaxID=45351 RepID=A7SF14_NEMVE|nr:predicted protein [Nematostella vectensis]|eukprot:XP_001629760.1 predicted protein [Nematostella vectensis]
MPILEIQTNVPAANVPDNFLKESTTLLAGLVGKPESYVLVCIEPGLRLMFGGTTEPAAIVNLTNIGQHDPATTKHRSKVISNHIQKTLGVPADRMYIIFHDKQRFEVGYNGATFH